MSVTPCKKDSKIPDYFPNNLIKADSRGNEDSLHSTLPTPERTPSKEKEVEDGGEIHIIEVDRTVHKLQENEPSVVHSNAKLLENISKTEKESVTNIKTEEVKKEQMTSPIKSNEKSKKGRSGRKRQSNASSSATAPSRSKPKAPAKKKAEAQNSLLTDYFPIRRSSRVPLSEIKKREQKDLEDAILSERTDGLKVEIFGEKGRGVVATKKFSKGEFVVEYSGDLVSLDDAKSRERDYVGRTDVGCYMYYFCYKNRNYCVDATAESGKLGRLLNHSKTKPNCCTKVVGIGTRPYLILVAARDISEGEELVYDYGDRNKETLEANPWLAQ